MQNTETGYASSVNVTKSRTRRKVTGEPRTLKGVRVVRRGGCAEKGFPLKGNTSSCTLPCLGVALPEGVVDHSGVDRQPSMGGDSSWPRGDTWSASALSPAGGAALPTQHVGLQVL